MRNIDHLIVGSAGGDATRYGDVFDPNSGEIQARVPLGTAADLDRAVAAAQAAPASCSASRNWSRRTWTRSPTCSPRNTAR
jgi:malonate-semialdehyde dehydrogenase (acetylating)/methylmalonate-semialdehyde dehydrogenase